MEILDLLVGRGGDALTPRKHGALCAEPSGVRIVGALGRGVVAELVVLHSEKLVVLTILQVRVVPGVRLILVDRRAKRIHPDLHSDRPQFGTDDVRHETTKVVVVGQLLGVRVLHGGDAAETVVGPLRCPAQLGPVDGRVEPLVRLHLGHLLGEVTGGRVLVGGNACAILLANDTAGSVAGCARRTVGVGDIGCSARVVDSGQAIQLIGVVDLLVQRLQIRCHLADLLAFGVVVEADQSAVRCPGRQSAALQVIGVGGGVARRINHTRELAKAVGFVRRAQRGRRSGRLVVDGFDHLSDVGVGGRDPTIRCGADGLHQHRAAGHSRLVVVHLRRLASSRLDNVAG